MWKDAAWCRPLENAVVIAVDADGHREASRSGLLRGVDPARGVGVVDLDGETAWLDTERIAIPHPILLPELDAWRELVVQLGLAWHSSIARPMASRAGPRAGQRAGQRSTRSRAASS